VWKWAGACLQCAGGDCFCNMGEWVQRSGCASVMPRASPASHLPPTCPSPAPRPHTQQAMCTSDASGQSFLKQAMQRAMPRADYGEGPGEQLLVWLARGWWLLLILKNCNVAL